MKKVLAVFIATLMTIAALTGCGNASAPEKDTSIVGNYTFSYLYYSGSESTAADLKGQGVDPSSVYLKLKADNTFEWITWDYEKAEGTYKVSGKNITLKATRINGESGNDEVSGTIENNTVTIVFGNEKTGIKMIFKKN